MARARRRSNRRYTGRRSSSRSRRTTARNYGIAALTAGAGLALFRGTLNASAFSKAVKELGGVARGIKRFAVRGFRKVNGLRRTPKTFGIYKRLPVRSRNNTLKRIANLRVRAGKWAIKRTRVRRRR